MHCSLRPTVLPLYNFQYSLNNPALRINRHRSLIETVLMSLGSVVSFPKTSYLCRAIASHRQQLIGHLVNDLTEWTQRLECTQRLEHRVPWYFGLLYQLQQWGETEYRGTATYCSRCSSAARQSLGTAVLPLKVWSTYSSMTRGKNGTVRKKS
jgi:hypothetical protein